MLYITTLFSVRNTLSRNRQILGSSSNLYSWTHMRPPEDHPTELAMASFFPAGALCSRYHGPVGIVQKALETGLEGSGRLTITLL